MQSYTTEQIRNVALLSHSGAGKTSMAEAMLFYTGTINRLGRVDEGSTTSDFEPEEIKRKISLNLSVLPFDWKNNKFNIVDTPGYPEFVGEVKAALQVVESAIIAVSSTSGVKVGTERSWQFTEDEKLPRIIFVNKMDRENADFSRSVADIQKYFGKNCIPFQIPIGAQSNFKGIIDLLTLKAEMGTQGQEAEIPPDLLKEAESYKEKLVEVAAEQDDKLLEKYIGGESLTQEQVESSLREAIKECKVIPILTGSALQNVGFSSLLKAVSRYLPSPSEGKKILATNPATKTAVEIKAEDKANLSALVFKTSADPYVGKLTFFRVFSGTINSNSQVWNSSRNTIEKIGQLLLPRGKSQENKTSLIAGEIGAVAKLSSTTTGDTLCQKDHPILLPSIRFPDPIFSMAISPKTKQDLDRMGGILPRLTEEDPCLLLKKEQGTGEMLLIGIGETHLDVTVEKMQRKFGLGINLSTPKIPYRETIAAATKAEYKHKKQSGGHGQYGHVLLALEPLARGTGFEFVEKVVGGAVPRNFFPAVEKGVNEAIQEGVLAGYPVVDVRVTLYDGSSHPVDSSEMSFKLASIFAVKKGLASGQPLLLEPIVNLQVTIPEKYTGDIIGDFNSKRGKVHGMNPEGVMNVIEAQIPLAEVQQYSIDLKSMTQDRGSYIMQFSHYEEVPSYIVQKIVAEKQAQKAEVV